MQTRVITNHSGMDDKNIKNNIGEVIRFGIVGVLATAIQYIVYLLLWRCTSPGIANTIGYVVSFIFNYFATTYFTFHVKASVSRGAGFAFSHLVNYTLQMVSLQFFSWIGVPRDYAPIPMFCVCVPVNFLLVRYFVKVRKSKSEKS